MRHTRIRILGVPVDCVTMQQAVAEAQVFIRERRKSAILAVNPEKVIRANENRELLGCLESAGLLIPDGIGVVVAAKLLRLGTMSRVPGSELMPELCKLAAQEGYSVFLFGASASVNAKAAENLSIAYPALKIAGRSDGYVGPEGMDELIKGINESGANILFVALGSPKQEYWIQKYMPSLNIAVVQGVGGTFDVIAGTVKRAPAIYRRLHLEWFYRLVTQPSRLLRQTALPKFAWRIAVACLLPSARS